MEQEKFHLKDHIMEIDKVMGIPQVCRSFKICILQRHPRSF